MAQRVDIVIPVYNEKENFATTYKRITEMVHSDWHILLVYDFPEDTTLEAAELISQSDFRVHLIQNNSRGVLEAIKTGFKEAWAPAVLVLMVDDSPEVIGKIDEMAGLFYSENATIIVPSRYVKGGTSSGSHFIKRFLSWLAGVSMHALIRIPVHDATNATRMYRKSFLDATPIESTKGFEFTLELTLKAYFGGGKIIEVPTVWRDRTIGTSRFKVLAWLPAYLRWYLYGIKKYWIG